MKKYSTPAYIDGENGETVFGSVDVYLASEVDARIAELEKAAKAVCDYDWSDNDEDAVRAVEKLRGVLMESKS